MTRATYLIGTDHKAIEIKNGKLIIREGGGFASFVTFMKENERSYMEKLAQDMLLYNQPIEWVVS